MATTQQINSTTQQFLDIYDITNDFVILKDGTTSLIITVDAMNFGLLAEEEQDSIMYAYAGLLNSLNYPIQILIKSQTKDVTGYLRLLKEQEDAAVNRVQQQRIAKYREFVSNLIRERNVLDKKFYVTIPAKPLELGLVPMSSVIPGQSQTDISTVDKTMVIEKAKNILEPKRDHLIAQFARIGLYSRQLETQEIIQMFYQSYNPEAYEGQSMDDSRSYTTPLVSASIEEINMNMQNSDANQTQPAVSTQTQTVVTEPVAPPEQAPDVTPIPPVENMTPTTTPAPVETTTTTTTTDPAVTNTNIPAQVPQEPVISPPVSTINTVPYSEIPQAQTSAPTQSYSPAQMPANTTLQTTTPLPPAPELPQVAPGQVDTKIPQEVEIQIDHPSSGQDAGNLNVSQEPTQNPAVMPPLPEIQ